MKEDEDPAPGTALRRPTLLERQVPAWPNVGGAFGVGVNVFLCGEEARDPQTHIQNVPSGCSLYKFSFCDFPP